MNIRFILFLYPAIASAHNCAEMDAALATPLRQLQNTQSVVAYERGERDGANSEIHRLLATQANTNWDCDYPQAQAAGLRIATAADKQFRAWRWDDMTGGIERHYREVWQYRTHDWQTRIIDAPAIAATQNEQTIAIDTAHLGKKGTAWFLIESDKDAMLNHAEKLTLLHVAGDDLVPAAWIAHDNTLTATLQYEYDMRSLLDQPALSKYPARTRFIYDDEKKTLTFPRVKTTAKYPGGAMQNELQHYRFDGDNFVAETPTRKTPRPQRKSPFSGR